MASSASELSEDTQPHYLTAEELRIGVFVILDIAWFRHSFPLSSFKIQTREQLRELKALGLQRYRFDPQRTDPPAETPLPPASAAEASSPHSTRHATGTPEQPQRPPAVRQYLQSVDQVELAFSKTVGVLKNLQRSMRTQPRQTVEETRALVVEMTDTFLQIPNVTLHVLGEKVGGEDVYFHSLNVTILAMMVARELRFSPEDVRELGVGAMLHDVGFVDIPDRVAKKSPNDATTAERHLQQTHVALGVDFARNVGLSELASSVVAQHHEFVDGSGYPLGLDGARMTPAAKLVSLVNHYDKLCNPVDATIGMTPHEALSHLFVQYRKKFDAQILHTLIRSLGVHPPGSLLLLSNHAVGVVTSVNPQKPLRPWVMLYSEYVPRDEAPVLNLETETSINIVKSIHPQHLPPNICSYLNPRRRMALFFGADAAGEASADH
ncbi:HD-GYP domain-containing protein [Candidatus Symbiobacter mobilis]|uniref:HD-GYP domain protein n=1 Tax=Candidatus Symbiobacter mobilis CR TaxID=946483 RepID=U5N783_9BURK|nr:HD-GYP domain-containing protein [Candidatus Symbiobacter mobilis]AGX87165.1 HD-GYP domain protein [Candidatus Symbiobacter mobilis CR]